MYNFKLENDPFVEALLYLKNDVKENSYLVNFITDKFTKHNFDETGYGCLQLFEPSSLVEISLIKKINLKDIENLSYGSNRSKNLDILKWLIQNCQFLPDIQKINLSYALNTIARYSLAKSVLITVDYTKLCDEFKTYYLFCDFCISNRYENDARSNQIFSLVKELIIEGKVNNEMIINLASQSIVWSLKSSKIGKNSEFMHSKGIKIVKKIEENVITQKAVFKDLVLLSSWYRALAMIPASKGELEKTTEYMNKAFLYADKIEVTSIFEEYSKKNLLKTYYESKIKEHIYLQNDLDAAEQVALKMIDIDKKWSISWQQLGKIYFIKENYIQSLNSYQTAINLGFPRQLESLFYIGLNQSKLENCYEAEQIFKQILEIDNKNISAAVAGYNLNTANEKNLFKNYIEIFINEGLISREKLNSYLKEAI